MLEWRQILLFTVSLWQGASNTVSPSSCIQTSTSLEKLVTCLDSFTVPFGYYDQFTYDMAQPTTTQRVHWKEAIMTLLSTDGNCTSQPLPVSLQGLYAIEPFEGYCLLYEKTSKYGVYQKGWGYMIVPSVRKRVSRNIHISAPHPQFDLDTVPQAASVFKNTGAKSFLTTGRARQAFMKPSGCIQPRSSPQQRYYKTDPAHNDEEPFFDANVAINDWLKQRGGCPPASCAFLQFHGKGASTCPSDHIFLSSGLGNSSASRSWYTDDVDRPIKSLQRNLRHTFPSWTISLPSDSHCPLTATKNVVGRHLNGIHIPHVCSKAATTQSATGIFIHAEQSKASRSPKNYLDWSRALIHTFDASCSEEMVLDPVTKICRYKFGEDYTDSVIPELAADGTSPTKSQWYLLMSFLALM